MKEDELNNVVAEAIAREIKRQLSGSIEGTFTRAADLDVEQLAAAALTARKMSTSPQTIEEIDAIVARDLPEHSWAVSRSPSGYSAVVDKTSYIGDMLHYQDAVGGPTPTAALRIAYEATLERKQSNL